MTPRPYSTVYIHLISPLVVFNIAMEAMALIEIGGLPNLKRKVDFPWRTVSHNQMVQMGFHYNIL